MSRTLFKGNSINTSLRWNGRRAELSHDILKNRIFPSAFKLHKVLNGEVEDSEFVKYFANVTIGEIELLCTDLESLADVAEQALSPSRYFEVLPLSAMDDASKEWFSGAIHAKWVKAAHLNTRLQKLMSSLTEVRDVISGWSRGAEINDLANVTAKAALLVDALQRLSIEVSDLATLPPYGRAS